ncbi:VanZ family protein [Flavobacterium sp.]|uniref:VanZ family protein n=1 Tax=Flavobacterium sp. TaxID=239 RepID=UPI0025DC686D|nr:VanZ family protein [Flavobacterium sp.]
MFFWIALCWTGVVGFFCLTPSNDIPTVNIPNLDKLVHAFFHFVFTILWFLFFKKQVKKKNQLKLLVVAFCFSLLFGIGIEVLQNKLTTTRSGDFFDVLANLTGAILAFVLVLFAKRIRKKSIKE